MTRSCDWCGEPITFFDAQTSTGAAAWHTRCWNEASEQRAAFQAEMEDCEGFTYRPLPDELPMSETGFIRSEVFASVTTAAGHTGSGLRTKSPIEPPGPPLVIGSTENQPSGRNNKTNKGEKKMNEVVKFPVNTAVAVTLQSEAGKHVEGRYGEQVMYTLADNRLMYVPLYVEQRFQELAIGAGEPVPR